MSDSPEREPVHHESYDNATLGGEIISTTDQANAAGIDNGLDLMPAALAAIFPRLYAQEKVADPIVYAKYFHPASTWTWYATQYDSGDGLLCGLVSGFEKE